MRRPGWPAGALLAELKEQVAEKGHVTSSGVDWVEIAGPGISKAYAAERVCKRLCVAVGEVLAIGDNHNDLTVLAWPGQRITEFLQVARRPRTGTPAGWRIGTVTVRAGPEKLQVVVSTAKAPPSLTLLQRVF